MSESPTVKIEILSIDPRPDGRFEFALCAVDSNDRDDRAEMRPPRSFHTAAPAREMAEDVLDQVATHGDMPDLTSRVFCRDAVERIIGKHRSNHPRKAESPRD